MATAPTQAERRNPVPAANPGRSRLPWRVPAALAVSQVVHWGSLYYAFSVLASAMAAELGASRGAVVGAFSAGLLAQGAAALVAGRLIDRLGARRVMAIGSLAAGLGLAAASRVATLGQLYAAWMAIGAVMAFTLYEAAFAAVAAAFGRAQARRGIAAVTLAGGFGEQPVLAIGDAGGGRHRMALHPAGAGRGQHGLRGAALAVPAGPARPGRRRTSSGGGRRAVARRDPAGAAVLVALRLDAADGVGQRLDGGASGAGARVEGYRRDGGAAVAALMGPMQVTGRLLEGAVARRAPLRCVGLAVMAALSLALAGLAAAGGLAAAAVAVGAYGAANGVLTIVRGAAPAELFGTRAYASAVGVLAAANAVAAALGPVAVAWLWHASGGYPFRCLPWRPSPASGWRPSRRRCGRCDPQWRAGRGWAFAPRRKAGGGRPDPRFRVRRSAG